MLKKMCSRWNKIGILGILLLLLFCAGCGSQRFHPPLSPIDISALKEPQPDGTLSTADGDAQIWLEETEHSWGLEERRVYVLPNGDLFYQVRLSFADNTQVEEVTTDVLFFPTETLVRRYDRDSQEWFASPLGPGQIRCGQYHVQYAGGSGLLVGPQTYRQQENQMLEYLPEQDGWFRSSSTDGGWQLELCTPVTPGAQAEYMYLLSLETLIDWEDPATQILWAAYDFTEENRWCYQGYYYDTPDTYIPSGDQYFHRLPAAYIPAQCGDQEGRACYDLALVMLHVMLELQNDQGFFPTMAGSQWLLEDYGIQAGFYDTRFNSDLVEALLHMDAKHNIPEFADGAIRYGQYYETMAETHHYTLDYQGQEAWLVWDYTHPKGCQPNHCSLNHQIAEILVLFQLYDRTGYEAYEDLALLLLNGILAIGTDWILDDNDLAYAYLPDGSRGMQDYPYLTYNDLFDLCQVLDQRYGSHDPLLDTLMEAKRNWMDRNGVEGYKQ